MKPDTVDPLSNGTFENDAVDPLSMFAAASATTVAKNKSVVSIRWALHCKINVQLYSTMMFV